MNSGKTDQQDKRLLASFLTWSLRAVPHIPIDQSHPCLWSQGKRRLSYSAPGEWVRGKQREKYRTGIVRSELHGSRYMARRPVILWRRMYLRASDRKEALIKSFDGPVLRLSKDSGRTVT
jgi:hypothetical protein